MSRNLVRVWAFVSIFLAAETALAHYSPRIGRFINRDPIAEGAAVAVRQVADPRTSTFIPRDAERIRESAGVNEYAFVFNSASNFVDPFGLCKIAPAMEHDCCTCLLYSEAGGEKGCLAAYVAVMINRQNTNWPDFRRERGFCAQAGSGKNTWAGGEGSKRYDNCCTCMNNAVKPDCNGDCPLTDAEAESVLRASDVCRDARVGQLPDPTGGAQYVGTKGAVTRAVGAHNIPNPCQLFQIPGCSSWFAKCSKRPLGK